MTLLESHLRRVALDLENILPVVGRLDAVRQRVLIHMAFNMGVERLRARLRFISAVQFRFWEAATLEMMFSDWGKPERAASRCVGRDDADWSGRARSVSACRAVRDRAATRWSCPAPIRMDRGRSACRRYSLFFVGGRFSPNTVRCRGCYSFWRAQARVVDGVLEVHGPMLAWLLAHLTPMPGGAAALTLGHVVIARDSGSLE